jgi:hypothetical protein
MTRRLHLPDNLVDRSEYDRIIADRPVKFTPEQVGYQAAQQGDGARCVGCWHFYRRATDAHAVCEIMRSEEIDEKGVNPMWQCRFFTFDGDHFPLLEED